MKQFIERLYSSGENRYVMFRYGLLAIDIFAILFFVALSTLHEVPFWAHMIELVLAAIIALDFFARAAIAPSLGRYLSNPITWADILVFVSLIAPLFATDLLFLRVMRSLRILRSHHILKDLRGRSAFFRRNEDIIQSIINLTVFVFVVTALVYVFQVEKNPQINTYIDALYFTVTTLTTTGFGDITLEGEMGRLLAVIIMVFGVALFLRLVQTIFRPQKIHYKCPQCGLNRHEHDAIHCKHCGILLNIETEGEDY